MIIPGHFIESTPYFAVHIQIGQIEGDVWFLADTGASRTTILDRDFELLGILDQQLDVSPSPLTGIGGSVRSFLLRKVTMTFGSDEGDFVLSKDLWVVRHDFYQLPSDEISRILRMPSLLGRDLINQFRFVCDYQNNEVFLESD